MQEGWVQSPILKNTQMMWWRVTGIMEGVAREGLFDKMM
jgi:hypothetical protein